MIVTDTAQMLIPGPETGHGYSPGWIVHNDDPVNEIYMDITPAIIPKPGAAHFVIPPGTALAVTGAQTFWARTASTGLTAAVHTVPSATYGSVTSGPGPTRGAG
ncbi:MAG TPA: hypothetical protein VGI05_26570 [Streptosporangiaceae bacterium]|jgi:hypothetical protein